MAAASPAPETVVLLTEQRSATTGRVHEIGTRARVLAHADDLLLLDVAGERLTCRPDLVSVGPSPRCRAPRRWRHGSDDARSRR